MKNRQHGFSLVELMVGVVISLLVTLAVAGSAQFLNTQKRITVGTNTVLEGLAISYREISNDVKMVGYGVSSCPSTTVNIGGKIIHVGPTSISADTEVPLQLSIVDGGDTASDSITSFYGDSSTGIAYSFLKSNSTTTSFSTAYAGQVNTGGLVLLSDVTKCDVYAVSGTPTFDSISNTTTVALNGTFNSKAWTASTNTYAANSMVLGFSDLKLVTQSIVNNTLQEYDAISDTTLKIATNVVFMKAFYGLTDGTFVRAKGSWTNSGLVSTGANINRIRSVRVFLVAREPVLNAKNSSGNCDTTAIAPMLFDTTVTVDLSATTDWKCYRYKTSDFIIPLRNKVLNDATAGA